MDGANDQARHVTRAACIAAALTAGAIGFVLVPTRRPPFRFNQLENKSRDGQSVDVNQPTRATARVRRVVMSRTMCVQVICLGVIEKVGHAVRRLARRRDDGLADRRVGSVVVLVVIVGAIIPMLAMPIGLAMWFLPLLRARTARRRRADRVASELPDLVELYRLAIAAGLTIHQATIAVASRAPGVTGSMVAGVPARVAVGERLADVLDRLAETEEAFRPLAAALSSAERYGVPLGPTLDRLSLESRMSRRRHAEEIARRLPVQMLFPLVLCILPAFGLLTVVPLALGSIGDFPH